MMQRVLHETCQQYLQRRLSEGWKCISLEGYNAVLLSPDGIRRELDLRNDVETLRPSAAGDETSLRYEIPSEGIHWTLVDEETPDDNTTYVSDQDYTTYYRDLYNIADHSVGSETINKVTVWARCIPAGSVSQASLKIACKTEGNVYESAPITIASGWHNYSKEWVDNPGGGAWTWTQIDALQAGIALRSAQSAQVAPTHCTQVYVEVDYAGITETPQAVGDGSLATAGVLVRKTSASFGLGSIAIAGSLIKKTSIDVGFNAVGIAGALIKKTLTGVGSGAVATAGALSTIWTKVIDVGSGAVTTAGTLARKTTTSVGSGAIAIAGTVVKKTSASFGQGSVALAGALIAARYHLKAVGSGVVSSAGTLAKAVVAQAQAVGDGAIAIAGSLTTVATHFKAVGDGAVAMSGNAAKKMYQTCGGALLDIRGYITQRNIYKAVGSGAIALAGSLDTVKMKLQAVGGGAISLAGDLTKLPKKVVGGGAIAIVGAVSKFPKKLVGYGTVAIAGSIVKTISKSVGNAAVSIWGRANAFVAGVPYTLYLSFDTGMDFELSFDSGDTRIGYESWRLDLDFIGGGDYD